MIKHVPSLDLGSYFFWLLVVSALCLLLERMRPWRRSQAFLRRGFAQDLFWLVFNGHFAAVLQVLGQVHSGHATLSQLALDVVTIAEARAEFF